MSGKMRVLALENFFSFTLEEKNYDDSCFSGTRLFDRKGLLVLGKKILSSASEGINPRLRTGKYFLRPTKKWRFRTKRAFVRF